MQFFGKKCLICQLIFTTRPNVARLFYYFVQNRILTSLETFLDNLDLDIVNKTWNRNRATLTFRTFALQLEEIDTNAFNGQKFTVSLGTVERARNISNNIDQRALITEDGEVDSAMNNGNAVRNISEATATLRLPPLLFRNCINSETNTSLSMASRQRLSYSVFLTDALFLPANRTLNKVVSLVVGARTSCQLENKTEVTLPIQSSFQILETVS